MGTLAPEVFNCKGRVVNFVLPYKAIVEFDYEGGTRRALLFSNRLLQENGEPHANGTVVIHALSIDDVVMFDGHELPQTGSDGCDWLAKRAWRPGSRVPIFDTGTVVEVAPRHGVILFDGQPDSFEARIYFLGSKFWYFGQRLNSKPLTDHLQVNHRVQFEAVLNEQTGQDADNMQSSCKYFARLAWKGQKPAAVKKPEVPGFSPNDSPRRRPFDTLSQASSVDSSISTPSAGGWNQFKFSHDSDELTSGKRMMADFWLARFLEVQADKIDSDEAPEPMHGEGTFWVFLDGACGLILWEREAVARSKTYETVFFHREYLTLAGESLHDKDVGVIIPAGCQAQFDVVPAPEEMPCSWFAIKASVNFTD